MEPLRLNRIKAVIVASGVVEARRSAEQGDSVERLPAESREPRQWHSRIQPFQRGSNSGRTTPISTPHNEFPFYLTPLVSR